MTTSTFLYMDGQRLIRHLRAEDQQNKHRQYISTFDVVFHDHWIFARQRNTVVHSVYDLGLSAGYEFLYGFLDLLAGRVRHGLLENRFFWNTGMQKSAAYTKGETEQLTQDTDLS